MSPPYVSRVNDTSIFGESGRGAGAGSLYGVKDPRPISNRVIQLVNAMTLEEKVAQLSCIARTPEAPWLLDPPPADAAAELVSRHPDGIGQLGRPSLRLGPAAAARLTNTIQETLSSKTRLGVPALFNEEGVHGHTAVGATMYPTAIALASTWDVGLVEEVFTAVAREVRHAAATTCMPPSSISQQILAGAGWRRPLAKTRISCPRSAWLRFEGSKAIAGISRLIESLRVPSTLPAMAHPKPA